MKQSFGLVATTDPVRGDRRKEYRRLDVAKLTSHGLHKPRCCPAGVGISESFDVQRRTSGWDTTDEAPVGKTASP